MVSVFLRKSLDGVYRAGTVGRCRPDNRAMDWTELREALRKMRLIYCPNQSEFAILSGINRKTINRLESIKREPSYMPEYDTIARWLHACENPSAVSDFLKKFEGATSAVTGARDTVPVNSTQPSGVPPHGTAGSQTNLVLASLDDIQLLERIALALIHARAALQREEALRRTHSSEPVRSDGLPEPGGSDAPHLRTVK